MWLIQYIVTIYSTNLFKKRNCIYEQVIESFTEPISSKIPIHSRLNQVILFLNKLLNHSTNQFVQKR